MSINPRSITPSKILNLRTDIQNSAPLTRTNSLASFQDHVLNSAFTLDRTKETRDQVKLTKSLAENYNPTLPLQNLLANQALPGALAVLENAERDQRQAIDHLQASAQRYKNSKAPEDPRTPFKFTKKALLKALGWD